MTITDTMNLQDLADRMGGATNTEAAAMRDLLVERYEGQDTADISESAWNALLNEAAQN